MERFASVIQLQEHAISEYERLHSEVWPKVLERIADSHISNYSIYRYGNLLFSYYEYTGTDLEADTAKMVDDSDTQSWWKLTDPLQNKVPEASEGEWWHRLSEVFHAD